MFVLISLVSLSGAVLTARAVGLSERARDEDARAIAEALVRQRARARIESRLSTDRSQYARYRALLAEAEGLEKAAEVRITREQAQMMREEAKALRKVVAERFPIAAYVVDDDGGPRFDEAKDRAAITLEYPETRVDTAGEAASRADRLRERSLRVIGFVVALAGVVVAMMAAQLSPVRSRPLIGGAATVGWLALMVVAFLGDVP